MLYAMIEGEKRLAEPKSAGFCPGCAGRMIAKCGQIKKWHWSHYDLSLCDQWHEPETEWHLAWKAKFPKEWAEIPIRRNGEMHIADIQRPDGWVIEFQHSPIGPDEIRAREAFYGKMLWVFDVRDAYRDERFLPRRKDTWWTFRWKHCRTTIAAANKTLFLDLGAQIFHVKKLYTTGKAGGWGYTLEKEQVIEMLRMGAEDLTSEDEPDSLVYPKKPKPDKQADPEIDLQPVARCQTCGVMTRDWWYYDGSTNLCRCYQCLRNGLS